jgi:2-methylcitrate dehydratase PrpD
VGHASEKGVLCASLARDGLTASESALEGRQGFLAAYNGAGNYRVDALADFGEPLEILDPGLVFKKYPCCGATHAPIDAALDLVHAEPLRHQDIEAVTIAVNRRRLPHVDRPHATTGLEAKFSLQYAVAAALVDGAIGLRHFSDAAIARPELQALAARVDAVGIESGESLSQACELTVTLRDGSRRHVRREDAEGRSAVEYRGYMKAKFFDCAGQVHDRGRTEAILRAHEGIERCGDVGHAMALLAGH